MAKFNIEVELDWMDEEAYSIDDELRERIVEGVENALLEKATNEAVKAVDNKIAEKILEAEETIQATVDQFIAKEMYGMTYRPLDMWDHLDEVLDDPHTLVIANPPTYFSGYEKFYDTQGKMTWKEPEYKLFDPETGHVELFDRCMNANALVVCYQEKRTGEAVGEPIFARAGTRADLNSYITSNRGEEAAALAEGRKIKRPSESKLAPIACSMLPRDYEITEKSKVQIISIKAAEAQYYRQLWTHNFVGSSATFNRAVLIDGMVSGVFGISKMQATSLFIWYVMKVPHTTYRLGRLGYQNRIRGCCFLSRIIKR